jgi:hypothetical protein
VGPKGPDLDAGVAPPNVDPNGFMSGAVGTGPKGPGLVGGVGWELEITDVVDVAPNDVIGALLDAVDVIGAILDVVFDSPLKLDRSSELSKSIISTIRK